MASCNRTCAIVVFSVPASPKSPVQRTIESRTTLRVSLFKTTVTVPISILRPLCAAEKASGRPILWRHPIQMPEHCECDSKEGDLDPSRIFSWVGGYPKENKPAATDCSLWDILQP